MVKLLRGMCAYLRYSLNSVGRMFVAKHDETGILNISLPKGGIQPKYN